MARIGRGQHYSGLYNEHELIKYYLVLDLCLSKSFYESKKHRYWTAKAITSYTLTLQLRLAVLTSDVCMEMVVTWVRTEVHS